MNDLKTTIEQSRGNLDHLARTLVEVLYPNERRLLLDYLVSYGLKGVFERDDV